MELVDERTKEERETLTAIVLATDRFMSGWGKAEGGPSYAGWACRPEDVNRVFDWVERRGDMQRVRIVAGDYRPPSGPGHCHIYAVRPGHPALK